MRMRMLVAVVMLWGGAVVADEEALTPAQRRIAEARAAVEKSPSAPGWSELALALTRRARETADPAFYEQADDAVQRSLALGPDNLEALKARAWVRLGQHRFAEGRDLALALNRRVPDDVLVYGLLTDAHVELGEYAEAERACQWMLDLRPGNVPALTRAAYLRELFGDAEGALEAMQMAFEPPPPGEVEDRAWISTQIGHLHLLAGRPTEAERTLQRALTLFPDYHYALAGLAARAPGAGPAPRGGRADAEASRHRTSSREPLRPGARRFPAPDAARKRSACSRASSARRARRATGRTTPTAS